MKQMENNENNNDDANHDRLPLLGVSMRTDPTRQKRRKRSKSKPPFLTKVVLVTFTKFES